MMKGLVTEANTCSHHRALAILWKGFGKLMLREPRLFFWFMLLLLLQLCAGPSLWAQG